MLLLRIWNYIRGYVIILVEGYFLEKFINICIHRQIFLWDIQKGKNYSMALKVSINGFRLLRPVARKTRCRVRIVKKRGLPFLLNRYRRRKAFLVGAVMFAVLFYAMTSFVWAVDIRGNEKVDTGRIQNEMALLGVKQGTLKYNIDAGNLARNLMMNIKELAWVGVTVKGTKVKVQVSERVEPPPLIPMENPCNIIARRDGVIKSIVTKAGQEMAKAGTTVIKGQMLISGEIANKNDPHKKRLVHSIGEVKARTWYEGSCLVQERVYETERTGRFEDRYVLSLFNWRFELFQKGIPFRNYDIIEIKKRISVGEDIVLPFELTINRYYENNPLERILTTDAARRIAADTAYKEASKDIPENAQIINSTLNFVQQGNDVLANVIIECLEDIGEMQEIGGK